MQRNKTVSNFRRDRDKTRTANNNAKTLKANKSVGHILRKDKKENNLEKKKKPELKYISMTPKRGEKVHNFYSKTETRSNMDKNKRFNDKKSENPSFKSGS